MSRQTYLRGLTGVSLLLLSVLPHQGLGQAKTRKPSMPTDSPEARSPAADSLATHCDSLTADYGFDSGPSAHFYDLTNGCRFTIIVDTYEVKRPRSGEIIDSWTQGLRAADTTYSLPPLSYSADEPVSRGFMIRKAHVETIHILPGEERHIIKGRSGVPTVVDVFVNGRRVPARTVGKAPPPDPNNAIAIIDTLASGTHLLLAAGRLDSSLVQEAEDHLATVRSTILAGDTSGALEITFKAFGASRMWKNEHPRRAGAAAMTFLYEGVLGYLLRFLEASRTCAIEAGLRPINGLNYRVRHAMTAETPISSLQVRSVDGKIRAGERQGAWGRGRYTESIYDAGPMHGRLM